MGTTTPSQDRAPAWLPTADIPLQRQAPPARPVPVVVPKPRARHPRPIATYVIAAGFAVGTVGVIAAVQTVTTPTTPPAASGGYVANVSVPGRVMTSFGDGTWQIGVDVEPGTYTAAGAGTASCRHALRPSRTGGATGAVGRGPATVVLTEADGWFDTFGCATWKRTG